MDKHDLSKALKEMILEIGRIPTRDEFISQVVNGRHLITEHFGGYVQMLQALGLSEKQRQKRGNLFHKDIQSHVASVIPPLPAHLDYETCLFIPDFHAPWGNMAIIEQACEWARTNKPKWIVQLGDLYDQYAHSKFPASRNVYTPREEERLAREQAELMWSKLKGAAPQAKCVQIVGNHDLRVLKRIIEAMPSAEDFVEQHFKTLMTFEGVETYFDSRDELILPGEIIVLHGYLSRPGAHRDYNVGFNVVHGHLHSAHVLFKQIRGTIRWELNCGLAADIHAKAFNYTPQKSLQWSLGFGVVDKDGPRFIPWKMAK